MMQMPLFKSDDAQPTGPYYVALDIETWKETPPNEHDWKSYRPLGISCVCMVDSRSRQPQYWFNEQHTLDWELAEPTADPMSPTAIRRLLDYLQAVNEAGAVILTWNGLQFDFDILAEECAPGYKQDWINLALGHIDVMYDIFCIKGYPLSLDKVAKGAGLPGKIEGMHGDLAPIMWQKGLEERRSVLEYCGQDVLTTLDVFLKTQEYGCVRWISGTGKHSEFRIPRGGWWTVREAMKTPEPDTSWMRPDPTRTPMTREQFTAWF